MTKTVLFLSLFSVLAIGALSHAGTVEEQLLDIRTRELAKTLRCAVCQTGSVWESNAPLAAQMRSLIRERLAQGQSEEEILAYFLSRYGDYILMEPRKTGLNWLLWAGPFVLLVCGGVLLYSLLRRWTTRTEAPQQEEALPVDDVSRRRIDEELKSLER